MNSSHLVLEASYGYNRRWVTQPGKVGKQYRSNRFKSFESIFSRPLPGFWSYKYPTKTAESVNKKANITFRHCNGIVQCRYRVVSPFCSDVRENSLVVGTSFQDAYPRVSTTGVEYKFFNVCRWDVCEIISLTSPTPTVLSKTRICTYPHLHVS